MPSCQSELSEKHRSAIKGINSLVLTGDIQDHRSNPFLKKNTSLHSLCFPFFLFLFPPTSLRTQYGFLHIRASAIMQMMATYLPECPWTTAFSNYEDYVQCNKFAIQNDPLPRSRGNCCRQIRLTLNLCFCIFSQTFGRVVCII